MQTFLLPYLVHGNTSVRQFVKITAANIQAAAAGAEENLRRVLSEKAGHPVCVAVAEVDFTWKDRATGRDLPRPAPAPAAQPYRRRPRKGYRRW